MNSLRNLEDATLSFTRAIGLTCYHLTHLTSSCNQVKYGAVTNGIVVIVETFSGSGLI